MKFFPVLGIFCALATRGLALDREAFTFTNYELNVRVEPEQQRLAVRGKLVLRNDSAEPQSSLVLQISSSLDWRSIKAGGKAVHFVTQEYNSDIDHTGALSEAIVNLPQEVPPNGTIDMEVGYEGIIPLDVSRLTRVGTPEEKAKHADWDQISKSFTAVRGIGYVTWYPIATEDASLTEGNSVEETIGHWKVRHANTVMKVSFAVTSGGKLWFSGTLGQLATVSAGSKDEAPGDVALGLDAPTFVIADYQVMESGPWTVNYFPGEEDAAKAYLQVMTEADAIVAMGGGTEGLRVFALPDRAAAPFVTTGMLLSPVTSPMTNETELAIVYAKAHQSVPSPRAWIQDGLSHFAQAAFIGTHKGRQAALDYLNSHEAPLVEAEKTASSTNAEYKRDAERALINSIDDSYLQTKAMAVWWMLRDMVGESAFKSALLAYKVTEDNQPTYLQKIMEKEGQRDLQWFFDDWVYRDRGLPDFRVASVFSSPLTGGAFLVTITVENLGKAGAEVPLTLRTEKEDIRKQIEVRGNSKASIRIETQSAPQQVTVNDGSVPESDTSNNAYKVESPNR
ncbi:MAG TPA: hypothetical protein VEH30_12240 [Terriglobales bacterium]|nr:hypothetical protein [Terriglobales bacterium]